MKFIFKKLLLYIVVLFLVQNILFLVFEILPGNPVIIQLGIENANNDVLKASLEEELGLNEPLSTRYIDWITSSMTGDFGNSISYENYTVNELVLPRLLVTIQLTVYTLLASLIFGIILSLYMIKHKDSKITSILQGLTILGISLPSFWIGTILISIFGVALGLISVSGGSLLFPIISLSIPATALIIKHLYVTLSIEENKPYIEFLKIKGMENKVSIHILKNSLIPLFAILSTIFISILTGSVLVENVFTLNGIGRFMVTSIQTYDYNVIQGIVMYYTIIVLSISWLVDILYVTINKRAGEEFA